MKEEREYYTYILANDRGMFYVGVTGDLFQRVLQHRAGIGSVYTKKYQCHRLVYYEIHQYVYDAIDREKQIKKYGRRKKEELIKSINPSWRDLFLEFGALKDIERMWNMKSFHERTYVDFKIDPSSPLAKPRGSSG